MNRTIRICFALLVLTSGCYTKIAVKFGNGTPAPVTVHCVENNHEVQIAPGKFKRIPNGSGDLVVTTHSGQQLRFPRIAPFDVDQSYLAVGHTFYGPNSVTLKVILRTNMELFVLMPNQATITPSIQQPVGYPKVGEKRVQ